MCGKLSQFTNMFASANDESKKTNVVYCNIYFLFKCSVTVQKSFVMQLHHARDQMAINPYFIVADNVPSP